MQKNYESTHALITGASRGLGRALALELAARGARVSLVARHPEALEAVVREIRAAGGRAEAYADDIGDKRAPHRIAAVATDAFGPVDWLVNNASSLGPVPLRDLVETSSEALAEVLETNVLGPFRLTKLVLGPMLLRGAGTVLNVSSDAAVSAYATWGAYGVSKAALDHLGRIWAEETAETGVRLLAVDPGEMDTTMHADAMPDADRTTLARPEIVARDIATWLARSDVKSGTRVSFATGALR